MALSAEAVDLQLGGHRALSGVSAAVRPGTVTALVGPNGAGKSSLLRVMSGELKPSGGTVRLGDRSLDGMAARTLATRRSVMTQGGTMAFDYYVEEVLAMGWTLGGGAAGRQGPLAEVVERCRIGGLMGRKFNALSGGERQRVQFARALLQIWPAMRRNREARPADKGLAPRYLLLDEPTASLDLAHELLVLRLARRATEDNVGVLVVLHDLNLAARFADVAVLLDKGTLRAAGPPDDVFTGKLLSEVYGTPVRTERHPRLNRLVVHTE